MSLPHDSDPPAPPAKAQYDYNWCQPAVAEPQNLRTNMIYDTGPVPLADTPTVVKAAPEKND